MLNNVFPSVTVSHYGLCLPQLVQKLPVLTVPHSHVQAFAGLALPQTGQKLPVLTEPQSQVHVSPAGAAAGWAWAPAANRAAALPAALP